MGAGDRRVAVESWSSKRGPVARGAGGSLRSAGGECADGAERWEKDPGAGRSAYGGRVSGPWARAQRRERNKPSWRCPVALRIAICRRGRWWRGWPTLGSIWDRRAVFHRVSKQNELSVAPPQTVGRAFRCRPKDSAGAPASNDRCGAADHHVSEQSDPGRVLLSVLGRRYLQPDDRGLGHREVESADHAGQLIDRICHGQGIAKGQLTLHSDNGGPMTGATMVATLERLGVIPSLSRPAVSDDNPYSESLFKTLKYRPSLIPTALLSIDEARAWVNHFVLGHQGSSQRDPLCHPQLSTPGKGPSDSSQAVGRV